MFDIAKYLEKFKEMAQARGSVRNTVAETIKEVCKIEIDVKKIIEKNGIVRINEKPIIKNEIFFKKTKILDILKVKTNERVKEIL